MNGSKNLEKTYRYMMMESPNDERIIVDVNKIPYNFLRVYYNYGCIVKGIGQTNGIRYVKNVEILNNKIRTSVQNEMVHYKKMSKEVQYQVPELTELRLKGLENMIDKIFEKYEV